ncbi:hypothetical protein CSW49_09185 [Thermus scotoductus]|nr:hypothetical protein CSW49_09185 [Thermus scotoductus]
MFRKAVVIGGGLLGLEAARGLLNLGMEVTVVPLMPTLMERPLDPAAARLLQPALAAQGLAQEVANVAGALLAGEVSPEEAREELAQIAEEAQALEGAQSAYGAQKGEEASAQAVAVAQALAPDSPVAGFLDRVRGFLAAWEAGRDALEQAMTLAEALQDLDPFSFLNAVETILEVSFPQAGARETFRALRRVLGRLEGKPPGTLGAELALALVGVYAPPEARHALTRLRLGVDWALRALGR